MQNAAMWSDMQQLSQAAQKALAPEVWHYLAQGDSIANHAQFDAYRLLPRPLADVRAGHTELTLFGQRYAHPCLLAPLAYQRLFHADGEIASAMAAGAQDGQILISSLASMPFADIASGYRQTIHSYHGSQADQSQPWLQLYWQGSRAATLALLQRGLAVGCSAIVFTVDAPIKSAHFTLPPGIAAVNLVGLDEITASAEVAMPAQGASNVFDGWMRQAPTWQDVQWLREQTRLPLLLKGILHPDDAQMALAVGCDGIIVSSHGGRVLPGGVTSLQALPAIASRIAGNIPILFDSGIRSGQDVFRAIALGASAVLIGRPVLWGLALGGALGVARVIRLLRDELEMTMALCGCKSLAEIGVGCLG